MGLAAVSLWAAFFWGAATLLPAAKPEEGIVYGEAGGEKLTMDYYGPGQTSGRPHPVAIIIHGGGFTRGTSRNNSEAYCADFLAPAGYAVFSINYRLAPKHPYPAMVEDVERAVRFIRHNAKKWNADPRRVALVGGSAGGYLSSMAGLRGGLVSSKGVPGAKDRVDRESARVQAVVTLFGPSDFRGQPAPESLKALLGPLIVKKGEEAALAEASPVMHISRGAPPFLLIHGDRDEAVPFAQSTHFQAALKAAGVPCDLILIPNGPHATGRWHKVTGVPDWEMRMIEWLNHALGHRGPAGEGIRPREP
ncbi:MAG: alpha/beta hydrolase [Bryobacterales bacterium]|nr:alpha/beta hydrolase [Bryobacterales bacterium]